MKIFIPSHSCVCKQMKVPHCPFHIQMKSGSEPQGQMMMKMIRNKIDLTCKDVNWHNMPTTLHKDDPMPTRNVVLTDHQALMIEELVTSGRYQNASEVLREGLRMLEQREKEDALKLKALQAAVQLGLDDIKAGRFKEFDSKASLRKHLKSVLSKVTTVA